MTCVKHIVKSTDILQVSRLVLIWAFDFQFHLDLMYVLVFHRDHRVVVAVGCPCCLCYLCCLCCLCCCLCCYNFLTDFLADFCHFFHFWELRLDHAKSYLTTKNESRATKFDIFLLPLIITIVVPLIAIIITSVIPIPVVAPISIICN